MLPVNTRPRAGLFPVADAFAGTVASQCISLKSYQSLQALILRGVNDAEAGTRASVTFGTTNSQLIVEWGTAGTVGNGKTVEVVEAGSLTALSVTVDTDSVVINLETDVMGDAVSTVDEVIGALYADKIFRDNWIAHDGVGDGTGVLAAAAEDELEGGADAGSGAVGTATITVEKCTDSSGTGAEAIEFRYRKLTNSDVSDAWATAPATGFTTDDSESVIYEIQLTGQMAGLAEGDKPFVRVKSVEVVDGPVNGAIAFVAHGARFGADGAVL